MSTQKLIIISGSPWVGKTTVAEELFDSYDNSALLDEGIWKVHNLPFSDDDPRRLRGGDKCISYVLSNYLNHNIEYVIFSSVLGTYESIRDPILKDITVENYMTIGFTLTCSEETLIERHEKRGDAAWGNKISFHWLHLDPSPNDYVINTDNKAVSQIVDEIRSIIDNYDDANHTELHTKDLVLKTVEHADIDEVARMWNFEKGSISLSEAQKAIERMQDNHKRNHLGYIYHLCFAVYEKSRDKIIGWCGLDGEPDPENPEKMEIFYLIDKKYRNKGYATQCALRLLEYAFETAMINKVFGGCFKDNISSFKVLCKSGMVLYKIRDNGDPKFFMDRDIYEKLKSIR